MRTVNGIRAIALSRRHALGLSQTQVAKRAGVSRKWISEFEQGKVTAELGLVLRLLDTLGLEASIAPRDITRPVTASGAAKRETNQNSRDFPVDLDQLLNEYPS